MPVVRLLFDLPRLENFHLTAQVQNIDSLWRWYRLQGRRLVRFLLLPSNRLLRRIKLGLLALGLLFIVVTFAAPYLSLGEKEGFVLYLAFGMPRTVAALCGALLCFAAVLPRPAAWRFDRASLRLVSISVIVVLMASVAYVAIGEVAVRAMTNTSLLEFPNFRKARGEHDNIRGWIEYDPLLGWTIREGIRAGGFNTLRFGIRRNSPEDRDIRTGGVLAVGSSFTAGSGVTDEETWPARLEALLGEPVINAGEGGFSADQAILRAEVLLPIVRPRVLILDLIRENIQRVGFSRSGWPKPYFVIENGALLLKNNPVPELHSIEPSWDPRDIFGRLLVADRFMSAFFTDFWHSSERNDWVRVTDDDVPITCALLLRIKRQTDAAGARMLLSMQYDGFAITAPGPPSYVTEVEDCARKAGIGMVDEFAPLRDLYLRNRTEFLSHYLLRQNGTTDHKSPFGNLQVARRVAEALAAAGLAKP